MLSAILAAAVVTAIVTPAVAAWARARGRLDLPNERSSHTVPTPRVGGLAIVMAVFVGLTTLRVHGALTDAHGVSLVLGALTVAALSFADDLRPLPVSLRLAGHLVVAVVVVTVAGTPPTPTLDALTIVTMAAGATWIVGLVNAYNFMDGIDGLAAAYAIVAAAGWAIVGFVDGLPTLTGVPLVISAASATFLGFNWHPARVFMGDTGSAFLGYAFAVLPFADVATPRRFVSAAFFVWPFLFDTIFTFVRRLVRGENVVQAHRTHLYQRLVATGLSHPRVSALYVALGLLGLPAGVCADIGSPSMTSVFAAVVAVTAVLLWLAVVRREAAARRVALTS
jgi:UDP-N-acetylmuramyl pentapeptide phosphotransferase/UDP-N-acetylglucosamine-1-phosphate transferase